MAQGLKQREYERIVLRGCQAADILLSKGIGAAFIYATKDGVIMVHGNEAISTVITEHRLQIAAHEHWLGVQDPETDAGLFHNNRDNVVLPPLDRPLATYTIERLRTLVAACVRASKGGLGTTRYIYYSLYHFQFTPGRLLGP